MILYHPQLKIVFCYFGSQKRNLGLFLPRELFFGAVSTAVSSEMHTLMFLQNNSVEKPFEGHI